MKTRFPSFITGYFLPNRTITQISNICYLESDFIGQLGSSLTSELINRGIRVFGMKVDQWTGFLSFRNSTRFDNKSNSGLVLT